MTRDPLEMLTVDPTATAGLLTEAARFLPAEGTAPAELFADAGVENVNATVDAALDSLPIRRVLAQVDVPHSAFGGHTPDEMFFGTSTDLDAELRERRRTARRDRVQANRSARCDACPRIDAGPPRGAAR